MCLVMSIVVLVFSVGVVVVNILCGGFFSGFVNDLKKEVCVMGYFCGMVNDFFVLVVKD